MRLFEITRPFPRFKKMMPLFGKNVDNFKKLFYVNGLIGDTRLDPDMLEVLDVHYWGEDIAGDFHYDILTKFENIFIVTTLYVTFDHGQVTNGDGKQGMVGGFTTTKQHTKLKWAQADFNERKKNTREV